MRHSVASFAFAIGSSALTIRQEGQQCVQLEVSGSVSGILGQLGDGQNRVGGGYEAACYCLDNGGFTDSNGRGCILTPPTTQFQCDSGATPTYGFAIGSSGSITYNGNSNFYACPVNDNGEYNIYSQPVSGQDKCVEVSLSSAGSCGASSSGQPSAPAPAPSSPAPSQPASSYPAPSQPAPSQPALSQPAPSQTSGSSCPADLNGNYQYPHLIVPISSSAPNSPAGTSYFGAANETTCSIFNFDIPSSYSGQSCSVVFLFPEQSQLETSSYTISGEGSLDFSTCTSAASQGTTWDNKPTCEATSSLDVAPGNSYIVASGTCEAGQTVTYEMCATGSLALNYFQDYNPSPIGLYIREC